MCKTVFASLLTASMLTLLSCGGSQHSADEKYYLVATSVKIPYWQQAYAGLSKAAAQLQVKAEMVGPDVYDPKVEHAEFQRILGKKPSGIMVQVGDPGVLKEDIDAAIGQGIPVITIDSDAPATKRLLFIGTDNYKAGVMGAEVLLDKLHGKGNVVVYTIQGQANLNERLHGYTVHGPPRSVDFFKETILDSYGQGMTFTSCLRITRFFEEDTVELRDRTLFRYGTGCATRRTLMNPYDLRSAVDNDLAMPRCPIGEAIETLERLTRKRFFET